MSISVGLRDQRAQLFSRGDSGHDGFVFPSYTFTVERWARIDESAVAVRAMSAKLEMVLDAVATFADEVTVPVAGVLKDQDGKYWWIRGIDDMRQTRSVVVGLQRIAVGEYGPLVGSWTLTLYDNVAVPNSNMTSGALVIDFGMAFVMVTTTPKGGGGSVTMTYIGSIIIEGSTATFTFTATPPTGTATPLGSPMVLTYFGHTYTFTRNP